LCPERRIQARCEDVVNTVEKVTEGEGKALQEKVAVAPARWERSPHLSFEEKAEKSGGLCRMG
jgi:hypothetical protein